MAIGSHLLRRGRRRLCAALAVVAAAPAAWPRAGAAGVVAEEGANATGYALCWSKQRGFSYDVCCRPPYEPACFDGIYTRARCCPEAENDPMCWEAARFGVDSALRAAEAAPAAAQEAAKAHIDALRQYREDDGLLFFFCCASSHNEYCWGPPVRGNLLPDLDAWEGLSDVGAWYARCCFPRLGPLLRKPTPAWMSAQIRRDFRDLAGERWPSSVAIDAFVRSQPPPERQRLCEFRILPGGQVRHCNFSARGADPRREHRARVFARALSVLAVRGELPRPRREVSFLLATSDIEWQDQEVPVLTFQRGKKLRRTVRVPMWEQLDGSWTRKVEQRVLSHESMSPFAAKRGRRAFWRGTDSAVPAEDCDERVEVTCEVSERTVHLFHRLRLVRLALRHPRSVDALLSGVKPRSMRVGHQHLYARLGLLERHPRDWTLEEQLKRRYLLDVDGSSQSTRLYWTLLSNALVFKQATRCANWYSDRLRPFVHFVPVRRDFADLPAQVSRMRRRPRLARSIVRRATTLAETWLSHEDTIHYLARVLMEVVRAQETAHDAGDPAAA